MTTQKYSMIAFYGEVSTFEAETEEEAIRTARKFCGYHGYTYGTDITIEPVEA